MQDRLGRSIRIGELVSISNHPEVCPKVNWEIIGWINHPLVVEVILKNFLTQDIIYIDLLDIEKEF